MRWLGHVHRWDSVYICRNSLQMELPGRRQRGRSKRFEDARKEDMQIVGVRKEEREVEGTERPDGATKM